MGDLSHWPWPQGIILVLLLAYLIFGGFAAWGVALAVGTVRNTIRAIRFAADWLNFSPPPLADEAARADWVTYLETNADAQIDSPEVAELLLREVRYLVDAKVALIKDTDTKASLQVTIFGGGLGVLSVLGASQSVTIAAGAQWLLILAVALILLGAIADLVCLMRGYRYTSEMPRTDVYNSQGVLGNPKMQARVASSLIEGYIEYSHNLTAVSVRKSRLLQVATVCFVLGVMFLLTNAIWAQSHPAWRTVDCRFSTGAARCYTPPQMIPQIIRRPPQDEEFNPVSPLKPRP